MLNLKKVVILIFILGSVAASYAKQYDQKAYITAAEALNFTREFDIIYHRQEGFALTMEKVAPQKNSNGAAIVMVMSGGWKSGHWYTQPHLADRLPNFLLPHAVTMLERGYTLFYVVHGTQPKFTMLEIIDQISLAVRYIRHHQVSLKIDGSRIGMLGRSTGGHLSLIQGTKGKAIGHYTDLPKGRGGNSSVSNELNGISDEVQAVVAYYPSTDFLNYGEIGLSVFEAQQAIMHKVPPVSFMSQGIEQDQLSNHLKAISPRYHITKNDAPALLLHGDKDKRVPLQQSELIAKKFTEAEVAFRLVKKEGAGHGWRPSAEEIQITSDWFDTYLLRPD